MKSNHAEESDGEIVIGFYIWKGTSKMVGTRFIPVGKGR